jgi:predicted TIM-barrel fold metal-dependent hydrolase
MQRRKALLTLAGMAALSALGRAPAQSRSVPLPGRSASARSIPTIDVHCHVFNARDLPIPGFVTDVYLNDLPKAIEIPAGTVIWFVSQLMDAVAISARDEANDLEKNPRPFFEFKPLSRTLLVADRVRRTVQRLSLPTPQVESETDALDRRIAAALKQASAQRSIPLQMPSADQRQAFLRRLAGFGNPAFSTNPLLGLTPDSIALGASKAPAELLGVLYLASLLTLPRAELTDTLAKLPTRYASDVRFFAPALVDYSYWLDDFENVSSLDDQIRVMSDVAARKGRPFAVHPYVSFCPWRQIVEPKQFDSVQQAIRDGGFVGVKLYPVMGFLPTGNAKADPSAYPEKLRNTRPDWASALDDALTNLYKWCVQEEVPILAHCSDSQAPSADAGLRGGPKGWRDAVAIDGVSSLRLNLGHLGGLWDLAKPSHNDWTQSVVQIIADPGNNLYADISDYASILHRPATSDAADDKAVSSAVTGFLRQYPAAKSKLMYGSDWVMLSKDLGAERYYPSMRDRLPAEWGLDAPAYLGANAARFIGLSKSKGRPPGKTRLRLEAFYRKHGLDKSLLALWDT